MKANNGVLIIDDFGGREFLPKICEPVGVPLDRGIEFLTLMGRKKD